jgi:hypothetical protein
MLFASRQQLVARIERSEIRGDRTSRTIGPGFRCAQSGLQHRVPCFRLGERRIGFDRTKPREAKRAAHDHILHRASSKQHQLIQRHRACSSMQDGTPRLRRCKPNKYHIQIITTTSFARKHCTWLISNRNSAKQLTNLAVACEYPRSGGERSGDEKVCGFACVSGPMWAAQSLAAACRPAFASRHTLWRTCARAVPPSSTATQ